MIAVERQQPGAGFGDGRGQVLYQLRLIDAIDQHRSFGGCGPQTGPGSYTIDLPANAALQARLGNLEDLELEA